MYRHPPLPRTPPGSGLSNGCESPARDVAFDVTPEEVVAVMLTGVPGARSTADDPDERLALIERLALHGHLDDPGLDAIVETISAGVRVPFAVINIVTENLQTYPAEVGVDSPCTQVPDRVSFCAEVVSTGCGMQVADSLHHPTYARNPLVLSGAVRSYAGEPLLYDGHVIGSVAVFDSEPREFTDQELRILRAQSRLASTVIALRATAAWDRLTGLALRPLLLDRIRQVIAVRRPDSQEVRTALLVLNVVGMSAINEVHGSDSGDRLLVTVAERLRATCGPGESPTRIGGDEFAVLFQDVRSRADARQRSEDLIAAVSAPPTGQDDQIVVRSGLAMTPSSSADALLAAAEQAAGRRRLGAGLSQHHSSGTHPGDDARTSQATSDTLDEFSDLALFIVRVDRAVVEAARTHHLAALAVLVVDHADGACRGSVLSEALLAHVRLRLRARIRQGDTVMSIGGDQFAVIWRELGTAEQAEQLAEQLQMAFDEPFSVGGAQVPLTASIGVNILETVATGEELVEAAVTAMQEARRVGPGHLRMFVPPAPVKPWERIRTGAQVLEAVRRQQLVLHYQPVVDLVDGRVIGVEALVRWQHPTDGLLAPDLFIPVAEATGSIVDLGQWVLEKACAQAATWHAQGLQLHMAVNLSTLQVADPDLLDTVARILRTTGVSPSMLSFEVTESAVIADADLAVVVLNALAALGASLSIDDFGTGYSSLVYLKRYPIQALKIDRAFVNGMGINKEDDAIVASVVALARAVHGTCVAEGVETHEQFAALRALGCRYGQGWLFGKAVPAEELPELSARCEQDLVVRLQDMPQPGDQRDLAGDRRDHAAGERDQAADVRDHKGDTRDLVGDRRDHVGDERDVAGDQRDYAADERDELGAARDLAADRRDEVGEQRDQVGERRDHAGDQRDAAADRRDIAGARRDDAGDQRDEAADRRDQVGARRDCAGDERDNAADQRDEFATQRDQAAEERDRAADARDVVAGRLDPLNDGSSLVAVARSEAASDRSRASQDRVAGANERTQAERDRTTALADRDAGASERTEAEKDRGTAQADRGAGAQERTEAEHDRDTALSDRDAGATERGHAEQDRDTALTDRGAGATERERAEHDRNTASADRGAGATERAAAEVDRGTALADRESGAVERNRAEQDRDTALADRDAAAGDRDDASQEPVATLNPALAEDCSGSDVDNPLPASP